MSSLCRCRWRGFLPTSLPALPGYRGDQFGWHRPLLCSGWRPLLGLSGLLQKCRFLRWPATTWDISHPALAHPGVIAAPAHQCSGGTALTVYHCRSQQSLLLPGIMFPEVPGCCCCNRAVSVRSKWLFCCQKSITSDMLFLKPAELWWSLNTTPGCTETNSQRSDIPLQHYFKRKSRQPEAGELHNTRCWICLHLHDISCPCWTHNHCQLVVPKFQKSLVHKSTKPGPNSPV